MHVVLCRSLSCNCKHHLLFLPKQIKQSWKFDLTNIVVYQKTKAIFEGFSNLKILNRENKTAVTHNKNNYSFTYQEVTAAFSSQPESQDSDTEQQNRCMVVPAQMDGPPLRWQAALVPPPRTPSAARPPRSPYYLSAVAVARAERWTSEACAMDRVCRYVGRGCTDLGFRRDFGYRLPAREKNTIENFENKID